MSNLLRFFPLSEISKMRWPVNLAAWMQEVHRAVSGDYNVIHLSKSSDTENIGGIPSHTALIQWDEEQEKQPGFQHSNTSNNSMIFVDNTGRYMVTVNVCAQNGASSNWAGKMYIKKNGTDYFYECSAHDIAIGVNWEVRLLLHTEIALVAGDYIQIEVITTHSGANQAVTTIAAECECIVRRIA